MGGKGLTNMSYANISDQVKFIDTIKFYQESLSELASSIKPLEHENIRKSITSFLETYPKFKFKFSSLSMEQKKWVIDYLSGGKGVIPYEMIKQWEDLNAVPELNQKFFAKTTFTVALRNLWLQMRSMKRLKNFGQL